MAQNPVIDLPAEASPQEIALQEEVAHRGSPGYDLPADASPVVLQAQRLIQDRFRERPPEQTMGGAERFGGAAAGSAIEALGGGNAASALELMAKAAKTSKVLQPMLGAAGGIGDEALGLIQDAAHDWAEGAKHVKDLLLPPAEQKGDLAERAGSMVGGLAGLAALKAQFGAAGLAATGAGQQAAPVYFHVLAKTGSEEKAIQAALPALGIGATYGVSLGEILAAAGTGTFGKLLLSGLGEGALAAAQSTATDAVLRHATGEQINWLKNAAEQGGLGFLTTTVLGMLHMAGAKAGAALAEKPPKETAQESPGAQPAEGETQVTEAERAWAQRFLARPETKEGPIGAPSDVDEALTSAHAAEKAGGNAGVPTETQTRERYPLNAKPSLTEPVTVPQNEAEAQDLVDRLWQVGKDHGVPQPERMKAMQRITAQTDEKGVYDTFHETLGQWEKDGFLPKKVVEEVPKEPESPEGAKIRLSSTLDTVGKAVGASDEAVANARRTMEAIPGELNPEDEFVRIANDLRKGAQAEAPLGAEAGVREVFQRQKKEPLLAPKLEESARTRSAGIVGPAQNPPTATAALKTSAAKPSQEPPKPDATEQLLYGGLPPLFKSRSKVSQASVQETLVDGLRKRGAVPEQAFLAGERAAGEVNAQATQQKILSRRLERAMTKEWGKAAAEGQEAKDRIQEALTNPDAMMALPPSIREHAVALRAHADANARTIVDQGMVDTPMKSVFEKGMGKHLRRQYQAHSDPEWAQKIEPDVRNRLKSLLVSWAEPLTPEKTKELRAEIRGPKYGENLKKRRELLAQIEALKPNRNDPAVMAQITELRKQRKAIKSEMRSTSMPQREAAFELGSRQALQGKSEDQIVAQMENMLSDAKAVAENPWAAIGASKLKRKDLSLFTARKGLPEEMRAFLGEIKDPIANYASTVMKQAQLIAAHRKFQAIRDDAMGKWLFEEPTIKNGQKYVAEVSSGQNPALEPLTKGKPLYTTEEIKKALFTTQPAQNGKAWRMAVATNALLKTTKLIWSPGTIAKQIPQNFMTALRAGHAFDWLKYGKEALGIVTGKDEAGLLEATRHRLIGESVAGIEYRDLKAMLADKELHPAYQGVQGANRFLGGLFGYPDTFAKIAGWKSETARLVETGMPETQAKQHAADIVRNLYPTASRTGTFGKLGAYVQQWRKQPIFGTYMAWNSEKIRTTAELYKLIHEELHSGNPDLRAHAMKRIGWAIAGEAALPTAVLSYNLLNGIDKQEDEDRRQHLPIWEQEKNVFWIGKKDKGHYISASDIDSNAWTTDSLLRLIQGDKPEDVLEDALRENIAPFVEPSMLTATIHGLITGQNVEVLPGKGKLIEVRDKDRAKILFDAVKPGIAQQVQLKNGQLTVKDGALASQVVGLSGFKPQPFDVRESLKYSQYDLLDGLQAAKGDEKKRRAAFAEATAKAQSAIRLGLSYSEVRNILDEKFGDDTIDAILSGGYVPFKLRQKTAQ